MPENEVLSIEEAEALFDEKVRELYWIFKKTGRKDCILDVTIFNGYFDYMLFEIKEPHDEVIKKSEHIEREAFFEEGFGDK